MERMIWIEMTFIKIEQIFTSVTATIWKKILFFYFKTLYNGLIFIVLPLGLFVLLLFLLLFFQ